MRRTGIEKRLFEAVLLVIAGSGCKPAKGTAEVERRDDRGAGDAGVAVVPDDLEAVAVAIDPADPEGSCVRYRDANPPDPAKALPADPPDLSWADYLEADAASWDPSRSVLQCVIVHERVETTIEATYTPTCCPSGRNGQPCPGPSTRTVPGTELLVERVELSAAGEVNSRALKWHAYPETYEPRHNCGRRPEGVAMSPASSWAPGTIGHELARMAELEAASVHAFDRLARELASHGAPAALIARAEQAMADEVRHARVMRGLAEAAGHPPRAIATPALPCRTAVEIAIENAVEGCVHEAYGALIATFQGELAPPRLRAAFREIAADERRHAALADDVDAWIADLLDDADRARVAAARARASDALRAALADSPACPELGLPGGPQAVALFDAYFTG